MEDFRRIASDKSHSTITSILIRGGPGQPVRAELRGPPRRAHQAVDDASGPSYYATATKMGELSAQTDSVQARSGETALAPKLPLRLGRFTLCEELGSGGMATVYLARMELAAGIERLAALKTIHPHLAKEKPFVDMFLDEARIASHVTHPNVCSTHDFGEVEGVYYLAMEYLLGEPLFDVINRIVERFDELKEVLPFLAARIIADACEGLHAAHSARGPDGEQLHIVHRDVSPQNLFLTYEGSVKVVDFGCAKAAERVAHTSTGVMKGKVGYAAPEQLKSDRTVDARADVWALGVCLWETLTLSPLFSRDTAVATAMAVLQDDIELASEGRDWVPEAVAEIANKALQRKREDRYASARDLGRDLRKFIADSGYTLESAELAEWMDLLFEDRHQAQAERARRVQELDPKDLASVPLYDITAADVVMLDSAPAPLEAVRLPDDDDDAAYVEASGPVAKRSRRRERAEPAVAPTPEKPRGAPRWLLGVLVLAGLALAGYYFQLYYEPAPWILDALGLEAAPGRTSRGDRRHRHRPEPTGEPTAEPAEPAPGTGEGPEPGEEGPTNAGGASAQAAGSPSPEAPPSEAAPPTEEAPSGEAGASEPSEPSGRSGRRSSRSSRSVTTVVSGGGTSYGSVQSSGGSTSAGSTSAGSNGAPSGPRVATGYVSVQAHGGGWAEVFADGRSLGRTPARAELPEGRHRLRIQPYGQPPGETVTVDIEAGLEESLTIEVAAQSAQ